MQQALIIFREISCIIRLEIDEFIGRNKLTIDSEKLPNFDRIDFVLQHSSKLQSLIF